MLPYDYDVLWSSPPSDGTNFDRAPFFDMLETHLRILHTSPPLVSRILNLVIGTGLFGFVLKLHKPSEANLLFDGASLVLYMCGVTVYLANIVKGLRAATAGTWGQEAIAVADAVGKNPKGLGVEDEVLGREDSLRVLAASNTILALVLIGVLVLQAGQWYAQHQDEKEWIKLRKNKAQEAKEKAEGGAATGSEKEGGKSGGRKKKNA
jgi:hypothetical protein